MRKALSLFSLAAMAIVMSAVPVKEAKADSCNANSKTADLCTTYPQGMCCSVYDGKVWCFPPNWINYFGES
jgi:hypothetical protein